MCSPSSEKTARRPDRDWDPDWAEAFKATGAGQLTTEEAEAAKREEVEQKSLGNLLRLNGERAGD
jgi:hypothetical protein